MLYKPTTVQIEFVQGCNRSCSYCGTMGIEPKLHYISKATLTHICALLNKYMMEDLSYHPRISITGHGEPALHPDVLELTSLIHCALPRLPIQFITNGYRLSVDALFTAGVTDLIIDDYDNELLLHEHKCEEIVITAESHGAKVYLKGKGVPFNAPRGKKRVLICPPIIASQGDGTRHLNTHCGAGMKPVYPLPTSRCAIPFRWMFIRHDGSVAICCNDFRGQKPICNVNDYTDLKDVWLHPRFEAVRKTLYHYGRVFLPCNKCNAVSQRPGLLPDHMGKATMPLPSHEEFDIARGVDNPLAVIQLRGWENGDETD